MEAIAQEAHNIEVRRKKLKKQILEMINTPKLKADGTPGKTFLFESPKEHPQFNRARIDKSINIRAYSLEDLEYWHDQISRYCLPLIEAHEAENRKAREDKQEESGKGIRRVGVLQ